MVKSVTTVRTGARTVTTARDRLLNMVVNGHWHCIGLNVEGTTLRTYMRLLLKHLIQLSRPSEASAGYRVRARALLLSLGLSSLMVDMELTSYSARYIRCTGSPRISPMADRWYVRNRRLI